MSGKFLEKNLFIKDRFFNKISGVYVYIYLLKEIYVSVLFKILILRMVYVDIYKIRINVCVYERK